MSAWWASLSWSRALLLLYAAFFTVCVLCVAISDLRTLRNQTRRHDHG